MKTVLAVILATAFAFAQNPAQQSSAGSSAQQGARTKQPHKARSAPPHVEAKPAPAGKAATLPYAPSLDLSAMDKSVDPCVDFYTYSCGGWMKQNPIPPDQSSWDVYSKLQDQTRTFLRQILDEAARPRPGRDAVTQKIGDFYGACMDEAAVEKLDMSPLKPIFAEIDRVQSSRALAPLIAHLEVSLPSSFAFEFSSQQDFRDASKVIAAVDQGGLSLPDRDYYIKDDAKSQETRTKFVEHMQRMFALTGESAEQSRQDAATVMRLETAMAKASQTRVERRDPYKLDHKMTPAQLAQLVPDIAWPAYFKAAGAPAFTEVNVASPDFMKEVNALLSSAPVADWKTYLRWHALTAEAPYLSSRFVNENFDFFSKYLHGAQELQPRWKRCVRYVDHDLGEALGQAYVRRVFPPSLKRDTNTMVKLIEDAMQQDIEQLTWMSPQTKQQALAKLAGIRNKVGYPDKWRDYSTLQVRRGDLAGNVQRAVVFEAHRQLNKIGKPVDHGEWQMTPATVNAYYDPQMNDINFPAAILQPPLYDARMDAAPNYGDEGSTVGHELTHAFDDQGRQFNANGDLKDWWTAADAKAFNERAQCVVDQYAGYTVIDNIHINSKLTEGEDVADLGGTILAYVAWKEATRGKALKPIDGLTPEQRFFIGNGQQWCSNIRPEELRDRAITDPHSPEKYRANGVVANMPEFAKAFSCKAGQPMVREKSCRVW